MIRSYSWVMNTLTKWWQKRKDQDLQIRPCAMDENVKYVDRGIATQQQIRSLHEIVRYNYKQMRSMREARTKMREQYYGHLFSNNSSEKQVVLNKIQDFVRIWLQNLASGSPQVCVESDFPQLQDWAWKFGNSVNMHLKETAIGEAFAIGTFDAFFSPTVYKTALGSGCPEVIHDDGAVIDPGIAFTEAVPFNDVVADMSANSPLQTEMIGNRYLRPKGWVKEMLKKASRGEEFSGTESAMESDMRPEKRITGHDMAGEHALYERVWCWDWYLPNENIIITIPDGHDDPIAMWEWDGPKGGPYDIMNLYPSSESPFGPAPGLALYEMHMFINEIMRKVGRQTNRSKDVLVVEQGAEKGAETISSSSDGMVITVPPGTLQRMQEMHYGGANPGLSQMLAFSLGQFDQEAGNMQSLGGLGPSTTTASGDELIHQSASSLIRFLESRLSEVGLRVLKKHAWWTWTEDIRGWEGMAERIPNTGVVIPWAFTPQERAGRFLDYNIEMAPYSMVTRTPSENAQIMMQIWNNVVRPNAELIMQSGGLPNAMEYVRYISKQYDVPYNVLVQKMDGEMAMAVKKQMMEAPPRLKESHTVNERVSRPGTTPQGERNEFMRSAAALAGQGGQ